jgi:hypothetical protein
MLWLLGRVHGVVHYIFLLIETGSPGAVSLCNCLLLPPGRAKRFHEPRRNWIGNFHEHKRMVRVDSCNVASARGELTTIESGFRRPTPADACECCSNHSNPPITDSLTQQRNHGCLFGGRARWLDAGRFRQWGGLGGRANPGILADLVAWHVGRQYCQNLTMIIFSAPRRS